MSHTHSYEFECKCGTKMNAEGIKKLDESIKCIMCNKAMDMIFYLRSPDIREKN
jgi:hypothetical protein